MSRTRACGRPYLGSLKKTSSGAAIYAIQPKYDEAIDVV